MSRSFSHTDFSLSRNSPRTRNVHVNRVQRRDNLKIRAAVLNAIGADGLRGLEAAGDRRSGLGAPGPGVILVKIGAAGLCHSDLSVINGDRPPPMPTALGMKRPRWSNIRRRCHRRKGRRSRRAGVRAKLRTLRPVRRRSPRPVRARGRGQWRRDSAFGARRSPAMARSSTIISGVRCSPNTLPFPDARWSRSTLSCRSTRQHYSAVRYSPALARWSTRRRSEPVRRSR